MGGKVNISTAYLTLIIKPVIVEACQSLKKFCLFLWNKVVPNWIKPGTKAKKFGRNMKNSKVAKRCKKVADKVADGCKNFGKKAAESSVGKAVKVVSKSLNTIVSFGVGLPSMICTALCCPFKKLALKYGTGKLQEHMERVSTKEECHEYDNIRRRLSETPLRRLAAEIGCYNI